MRNTKHAYRGYKDGTRCDRLIQLKRLRCCLFKIWMNNDKMAGWFETHAPVHGCVLGGIVTDWLIHQNGRSSARKWCDVMMTSWRNPRISRKGIKRWSELLNWPEPLTLWLLSSFPCTIWCTLRCVKWILFKMVDWWKYTGLHSAHFHMQKYATGVYSAARGTLPQSTIMDYGRILLYLPWVDR